jgi:NAD-dependent deacetylase
VTVALQQAVEVIRKAEYAIASTGAGMSVESGIPDFRGPCGIWQKYPPEEYATIDAYRADPDKVWKFWNELGNELGDCKPNPGHHAMAELERLGHLKAVITQNVDHFHQDAGNSMVIEYHGSTANLRCLGCQAIIPFDRENAAPTAPQCQACGGLMKPDVIMFGEMIPEEALGLSAELAERCDLVLVVGTSAHVFPAAQLPTFAKEHGATIIECNTEPTDFTKRITDIFLQGRSGEVLPELVSRLKA